VLRRTSGGAADTLWTRREYFLVGLAAAVLAADSPPRICRTTTLTTTPHSDAQSLAPLVKRAEPLLQSGI